MANPNVANILQTVQGILSGRAPIGSQPQNISDVMKMIAQAQQAGGPGVAHSSYADVPASITDQIGAVAHRLSGAPATDALTQWELAHPGQPPPFAGTGVPGFTQNLSPTAGGQQVPFWPGTTPSNPPLIDPAAPAGQDWGQPPWWPVRVQPTIDPFGGPAVPEPQTAGGDQLTFMRRLLGGNKTIGLG
jgi:hypothetical protein